jgi:hypothetical protein
MRFIKEKLKQHPMTLEDILDSLTSADLIKENSIGKRSVQNYIAEMKALNILRYDKTSGFYTLFEDKQVFQSRADYEIALQHSQTIFFSDEQHVGLDFACGPEVLRRLAFLEDEYTDVNKNEFGHERTDFYYENYYLLQHIKTGYPEAYEFIKKYKQLAVKQGINSSFVSERYPPQPNSPTKQTMTKKEKIEFVNVADLFGDHLHRMVRQVKDRVPLCGRCDGCPSHKITIKDL